MNETDDIPSPASLREEDFEAALERNGALRGVQVLYAAFGLGVLLFVLVAVSMYFLIEPPGEGLGDVLSLLSLVHAIAAVTQWSVGFLLFNARLSPASLRGQMQPEGPAAGHAPAKSAAEAADDCVGDLRAAFLIRAAMFEGAALFGVVVCLLGSAGGGIREAPIYWLNLLSALVLFVFLALTFPTRQHLVDVFRMKIADS